MRWYWFGSAIGAEIAVETAASAAPDHWPPQRLSLVLIQISLCSALHCLSPFNLLTFINIIIFIHRSGFFRYVFFFNWSLSPYFITWHYHFRFIAFLDYNVFFFCSDLTTILILVLFLLLLFILFCLRNII